MSETAERAVEAYGGAERWRAAEAVEATANLKGLLFRVKWRMPRSEMKVHCEVHRPMTRIDPIDRKGHVGVLEGPDTRLETQDGRTVEVRPSARDHFRRRRRTFYWDALDLTYFLGYAFWNYFTLPALLTRDDIVWTEVEKGVLESRFPPELPTHAQYELRQRHMFDPRTGLLARYDYQPEIVTSDPRLWIANVVLDRGTSEGIPYEARRRVTAVNDKTGEPKERPTMIDMRFSDWRLL